MNSASGRVPQDLKQGELFLVQPSGGETKGRKEADRSQM